jgi:cyclic pyranopterin phosphate synthase
LVGGDYFALEMKRKSQAPALTHLDAGGHPAMIDVGEKPETQRTASAEGWLRMGSQALQALEAGTLRKGDPLVVARIAGIQAAKRTAELIPLCHSVPLSGLDVNLELHRDLPAIRALASARVVARTGVEMEALTAVSVALLTAYDMLKAVDRGMRIEGIRLLHKSGGRSGRFDAETEHKDAGGDTLS